MTDFSDDERTTYLLTKRAAGFLVLEETGTVRQAIGQIRTLVADAVNPLAGVVQSLGETGDPDIRSKAIRSLQFADLVDQLGAYCDTELNHVEELARELNHLVNELMDGSPGATKRSAEFLQTLDARLQALRKRLAHQGHKSVVQTNMDEGDIELF